MLAVEVGESEFDLQHPHKKPGRVSATVISVLGRQRQGLPWGLAGQPVQLKWEAPGLESLSQKTRWRAVDQDVLC